MRYLSLQLPAVLLTATLAGAQIPAPPAPPAPPPPPAGAIAGERMEAVQRRMAETQRRVAQAQARAQAAQQRTERAMQRHMTDTAMLNRAVLGISLGRTGVRDTLGIFITSVAENGPAERAGIVEGERIAAINGVDVRASARDAGDPYLAGVAHRRLTLEMRRLAPGQRASLRVWSGGRYRDVQVTAGRYAEVYPGRRVMGAGDVLAPLPPLPRIEVVPQGGVRFMLLPAMREEPAPAAPSSPPENGGSDAGMQSDTVYDLATEAARQGQETLRTLELESAVVVGGL